MLSADLQHSLGWKGGDSQMLSGVETPGCFLRDAGMSKDAAAGLPGARGSFTIPYSPLRVVPGTSLPKAGDLWSCRIAQPVPCAAACP